MRLLIERGVGLDGQPVTEAFRVTGVSPVSNEHSSDMAYYDVLPEVVKRALDDDCIKKWSAKAAYDAVCQGYAPAFVAKYVRDLDAKQCREDYPYGTA